MLKIIRAKLHGIYVTGADLNYHGSITLDPVQCEILKIYPLEFVEIWNKTNGERFSTYVIYGEPESRCCVLNGAAARKCQKGDILIIGAYKFCNEENIKNECPKILTFNEDNSIKSLLEYKVEEEENWYKFSMHETKSPLFLERQVKRKI